MAASSGDSGGAGGKEGKVESEKRPTRKSTMYATSPQRRRIVLLFARPFLAWLTDAKRARSALSQSAARKPRSFFERFKFARGHEGTYDATRHFAFAVRRTYFFPFLFSSLAIQLCLGMR